MVLYIKKHLTDFLQFVSCFQMERMVGIEPATSAWEADVLPLNYTRIWKGAVFNRIQRRAGADNRT